jgi:hypothetical protein
MSKFDKIFHFEPNLTVHITRCSKRNVYKSYKLIPINHSAFFYFRMRDPLTLPKLYVALTLLTGPQGDRYDDHKGSYSFAFELKVQKGENLSLYFLNIVHYRSYIDFILHQIVPKTSKKDPFVLHSPDSELFSEEDIHFFCSYFCNYALGYLIGYKHTPDPFVKSSDSNLILFGYFQDDYFCYSYDDRDEYYKDKEHYSQSILESNGDLS